MKNIIKIFTLLVALLTVTNTADARLRGDAATRVTTGSIIGGRLDYYSDAKCENWQYHWWRIGFIRRRKM